MYAFVKSNSGTIYQTVVFGCYKENYKGYDYYYYIVLDEAKTKLIKQFFYDTKSRLIKQYILTTDCKKSNWNMIDENCGQINFFDENLPELVESNSISADLLKKCIELDKNYIYKEWNEIKDQEDIENLDWTSGNFHDAYLTKTVIDKKTDSITILMEGCWGCSIEICFSEIANFNIHVDDIRDDYWFSSNMYFKDGFFCLINEEDCEISDETTGYIWFMGKEAKYRIIPNL